MSVSNGPVPVCAFEIISGCSGFKPGILRSRITQCTIANKKSGKNTLDGDGFSEANAKARTGYTGKMYHACFVATAVQITKTVIAKIVSTAGNSRDFHTRTIANG